MKKLTPEMIANFYNSLSEEEQEILHNVLRYTIVQPLVSEMHDFQKFGHLKEWKKTFVLVEKITNLFRST